MTDFGLRNLDAKPSFVVVDTNVLMRVVVLEFGTREWLNLLGAAAAARIQVVLGPLQVAEFWRNVHEVFSEHVKSWKKLTQEARSGTEELLRRARALESLGLCPPALVEVARKAKSLSDSVDDPSFSWSKFEEHAEEAIARLCDQNKSVGLDQEEVLEAAKQRVAAFHPPCRDGKPRHMGDCSLWETVLCMLNRDAVVWFASTDSDFSSSADVHSLHPFLQRELRGRPGRLTFLHENRNLGLSPGSRFATIDALLKFLPDGTVAKMRKALDVIDTISPGVSLERLYDALRSLPYRDRELLKLRLGLGDGFEYSQEEIGAIFRVSQQRVSQLERVAYDRLKEKLLAGRGSGPLMPNDG